MLDQLVHSMHSEGPDRYSTNNRNLSLTRGGDPFKITWINKLPSSRRKSHPAENSFGGKSGHPVQPRLCHSQPRRSLSWENHCSHHTRRKVLPAGNSAGGKSDHPFQPRYSPPWQSSSGENPTQICNHTSGIPYNLALITSYLWRTIHPE